jgi:hypothetical protein
MAATKKSAKSAASVTGTLLSTPFKPGKDGIVYFYFWMKYIDKPLPKGKAALSPTLMKAPAKMTIVDVGGDCVEEFAPFAFDVKHLKPKPGHGQFAVKWITPGSTRKQAEAWIKSADGKAWAGDFATALGTFCIRVF